jgi:hypothetical protein
MFGVVTHTVNVRAEVVDEYEHNESQRRKEKQPLL